MANCSQRPVRRRIGFGRQCTFETKDFLKARGYRWNDGRPKAWHCDIEDTDYQEELKFLEGDIYGGSIDLPVTEITALERFSNRV